MLRAHDLSFSYSAKSPVLMGVSLTLQRGRLAALIGANGSGKSTVVRLLAALLAPTGGVISFDGKPLTAIPKNLLARKMAYIPQSNVMIFPFTALEVVLTGRSPCTPRFHFENRLDCEKACAALEIVGALHLAQRRVTELSGGERQLVAFARALAQEPECLLLDEPSASLDLKHRAELIQILIRLRDQTGLTALVVTHDLQLLDPEFDHVFAMRCGSLVAEGRPSEVLTDGVLAGVYDDPLVHARRIEGRTFVWSGVR